MPDYLGPQIDAADDDPQAILANMVARLQDQVLQATGQNLILPDSSPWLLTLEAVSIEMAETRRAATGEGQTYDQIARWLARSVFLVSPRDPIAATGAVTFTARDTAGYTIPAGTQISLQSVDGTERVGFETTTDAVIAAGQSVSPTVEIVALEEGAAGNELQQDPQLEDRWDFLASTAPITVLAPTSGGDDGETDAEFLDRFARTQRRMADGLITDDDFAAFARDFYADGGRALVLPLYDGQNGVSGVPGAFTVVPIDPDGQARSVPQMAALKAAIDARLLTGVQSFVIAPKYTTVDVQFTATSYPPYDPAAVQAAAVAAVEDFLSPARWGLAPYGDEPLWLDKPTVRANDLIAVLETVQGLDDLLTLTVNGVDRGDVTLTGPAGLPQPGLVTGAVTA